MVNPYIVLGLDPGADATECKKSFRKLLMVHHPDKGGNNERFLEIVDAYKCLEGRNFKPVVFKQVYTLTHSSLFDFQLRVKT